MNDVTFRELVESALRRADFPKLSELDVEQQADVKALVNEGLQAMWEAMIDSRQESIFKIADDITIVADTEAYSLPRDFYKAVKVWWREGGRRYRMERFELDEIDGFPKPLTAGTVEMWYAPPFQRMKILSATVPPQFQPGWEQYGALYAAARLLDDEGTDSTKVSGERDGLLQRVRQVQGERDEQPATISDYYNRFEFNALKTGGLSNLRYRIMGEKVYFVEIEQGAE